MGLKGNNRSEDPPALVVLGGGSKGTLFLGHPTWGRL